jgi:hypothetical protein
LQSFLSEIHVVPHRVRAGSVTLSRVGKINLSLPDHGWSAAFLSRRMTRSFLSEIHVVPHRVRAGSVTLSRVGKINLSLPDHGWSAAFPSQRMTRYLNSVGMSLRCGCSRQWPEKKDKSMSAPLTKFRTQAFDPHQMPSYSLIYSINGVIY